MLFYSFNDNEGQTRVSKLPIQGTEAQLKELLGLFVSGDGGYLFLPDKSTILDSHACVSGVTYACIQVTCTHSEGSRISFPMVSEETANEGVLEAALSDGLMGLDMLGDGMGATVTRVTVTVVATFVA